MGLFRVGNDKRATPEGIALAETPLCSLVGQVNIIYGGLKPKRWSGKLADFTIRYTLHNVIFVHLEI
jgi:hypothetical protein